MQIKVSHSQPICGLLVGVAVPLIMSAYYLKTVQQLPVSLEKAWDFFSKPKNLQTITPQHMGFKITSPAFREEMYAGQIITYRVKPVLNIPLFWMTEITHVADHQYFIDEQRFGPYALWHHQHHFKAVEGGVEMVDLVHYKLPLGPLGSIANGLFVEDQLRGIFAYRYRKVIELFGPMGSETPIISFGKL